MRKIINWYEKQSTPVQVGVAAGAAFLVYKGVQFLMRPAPVPLPAGGAGIPVVGYGPGGMAIAWSPAPLSNELNAAMNGLFTFTGTKDEAWSKLLQLPTPDMVTAVYNDFNARHGGGSTLTQWIRDEIYYDPFTGVRDATLARLALLGLP